MPGCKSHRAAATLAGLLLLALAAGWIAQPVADTDLWWHLSAGRHIVQTAALPVADPTGMYEIRADNAYWADTVLRGQWLGQVALYLAWRAGGIDGVGALRTVLLLGALMLAVARAAAPAGGAPATPDPSGRPPTRGPVGVAALLLALPAALCLQAHGGERPQLFSFALFGLLLALLEHRGRHAPWLMVPLLALWAHLHPGVLLGASVATLWLLLDAAGARWRREPLPAPGARAVAVAAGWAAVVAAPAGRQAIEYLIRLEADPLKDRVIEYRSPLTLAGVVDPAVLAAYAVLMAAALGTLAALLRRRRTAEAGTLALLAALSLSAWRYMPFLVLATLPWAARAAAAAWPRAAVAATRPAALALAGVAAALLLHGAWQQRLYRSGLAEATQPVAMAAELARRGAQGRLFNTLAWGGYLHWTLGPRVRPFLDGRLMDPARVRAYTHMLWATPEGLAAFEAARFDLVLMPRANPLNPSQRDYPLVGWLQRHPAWRLAGDDGQALLFVRR